MDGGDDLLFRMGFESHPDSGKQLESLAKAVELTQDRISKVFTNIGDQVMTAAQRVEAMAVAGNRFTASVRAAGKSTESPVERVEAENRRLIEIAKNTAAQRVAIEKETFDKIQEIRKRDVESADAAQKRMGELSAIRRPAVARRQTEEPVIGPSDESARRAVERAKETSSKILDESERLKDALHAHRNEDVKSAEFRSEMMEALAKAQTITEQREADALLQLKRRLAKDIELVERGRAIGTPRNSNEQAMVEEAERAAARVALISHKSQMHQEAAAKAAEALRKRQAAEAERASRQAVAAQEKAAKEAERIRKAEAAAEARDIKEAINARKAAIRERENIEAQNRVMARESADPWIEAYQREMNAHDRAMRDMAKGRRDLVRGLSGTASALGTLSRGAVLLGLAQGEEMEKVLKKLAAVQSAIDLIAGTGSLMRNVAQTWESLRLITLGSVKAKQAEAAAGRVAAASSADLTRALSIEALAANRATVAHTMLSRARGGGVIGGMVGQGVGGAAGRAAGGGAARAAGGVGASVAGGAAASAAGGGVRAAVVGAGAKAVAASGAAGLGTLAAAAAAAAAGLAFAGKAAWDFGRDSKKNGVGGGSEKGSWSDTIGGSDWNPFSWAVADREKMDAARSEERTKRMEHLSKLYQLEVQHVRNKADIRGEARSERVRVDDDARDRGFSQQMEMARTPEEKLAIVKQQETQQAFAARTSQFKLGKMDDGGGTGEASEAYKRTLEELDSREAKLKATQEQRIQLERQVFAEKRKNTMDEIRGIEDVINARLKERKALEDSYKSAKERFGEMSMLDQKRTVAAVERARKDPKSISETDARLLKNVDTDEVKQLLSDRNLERADRSGADRVFQPEFDKKRNVIDKDLDQQFGDLSQKSGQAEADLRRTAEEGQLAGKSNVEIVDRTTFEIQSNVLEDNLVKRILDEIEARAEERDERIKKSIEANMNQRLAKESEDYRKRVDEARAED
jgi:hypothetical protein